MKKMMIQILFVLLGAALLSGCSDSRPVLNVYTWADYMNPDVLKRFEKEQNCRVVVDTFDSNEAMYAKLKAGAQGYDLILPTSYMVGVMKEQGMIQPLIRELIPNIGNVDRSYLVLTRDPQMEVSVPYMISVTGIGYNKARLGELEPSWAVLSSSAVSKRCTLLNDMRETIGAALKSLGYSLNSTNEQELAEAQKVLIGWKKNIAKFEVEEAKRGLASTEFLLVHAYNGDILQAMGENEDLAFFVPREGTSIASDDMVIPANADQVELAHAFINFILEAKNSAESMEFVSYLAPNIEGQKLVSPEFHDNPAIFVDAAILAKSEVLRDLGADNDKYTRVWDAVKAAE
ncbi:MAG: spermidine/putrescine ABC transporter substrate-binding protein [Kiritimatiellaceae bacterium]|nr:spermidine/putrescine ABC transporter substrate-binding protein [Kiritimatiellaceae bacterium]